MFNDVHTFTATEAVKLLSPFRLQARNTPDVCALDTHDPCYDENFYDPGRGSLSQSIFHCILV